MMQYLRENWRITLLVALLLGSFLFLLVPGTPPGTAANATDAPTNLQYGIQLSGGTQIRAPIVGTTAENVNVSAPDAPDLKTAVARDLGVDQIDVRVSARTNTVEVFRRNVSQAELASTLQDEGYDVTENDVRDGVAQATREDMVDTVRNKIRQSALSGGSVQLTRTPLGEYFIEIQASDRSAEELRSLLNERGVVRFYAGYPGENDTYVREQLLAGEDFTNIGSARRQGRSDQPGVSVTITEEEATRFSDRMVQLGYGDGTSCNYIETDIQESTGRCMVATLNGDVVFAGRVTPGLGQSFVTSDFTNDPTFVMSTTSIEEARELEISLKTARLPAPLDFDDAQVLSLSPGLADRFRLNSAITGLVAVLAVSMSVYVRYGDPKVALPMIVTALSEVAILLGFVAAVQYPLNLSHIAGFIAVIGTGVDDLIIIADEVLQEGTVATGRVFQNRFRKAFWVIGAAAATTIVAMSPLAVLGLGDLQGFAIVTIVGVLIGVLVTRPAYGDILRKLMLEE
jgi:preprotein translocase subunit SecD